MNVTTLVPFFSLIGFCAGLGVLLAIWAHYAGIVKGAHG